MTWMINMREKILSRIYRLIFSRIIDYVEEPKEKILVDESMRDLIVYGYKGELLDRFLARYDENYLENLFHERYFIIDRDYNVNIVHSYSTYKIIEEIYNKGITNVMGVVRSWPTIPPHILHKDLKIASELNAKSIGVVSKRGNEVHILLMKPKTSWEDCINNRDEVSRYLFEKADMIVPVLVEGYEYEERFDSFNVGDKILNLYPEVSEEKSWKEAIEVITRKYIGSVEFPQYFFVKLI